METWKGRPIITASDHPVTVYKALLRSVALGQNELSIEKSAEWTKIAQDSWDTIRDGFGFIHPDQPELWKPNGEARLYMSMDDLEYTLVGYGVRMLDEDPAKWADEIKRTDAVLVAIDKALNRKKLPN
jgi:hypothetical protein